MRVANIVIAGLFALFAIVQLNDPDPFRWVLLYGVVATMFLFAAFGQIRRWAALAFMAICVVEFARLVPEFINWINMGMPTITGEMKAKEPHIEYTREFLGLLLCILSMGFLYYQSVRKKL